MTVRGPVFWEQNHPGTLDIFLSSIRNSSGFREIYDENLGNLMGNHPKVTPHAPYAEPSISHWFLPWWPRGGAAKVNGGGLGCWEQNNPRTLEIFLSPIRNSLGSREIYDENLGN